VGDADCPSVSMNEMYRFQPIQILADWLGSTTPDLLPSLRIAESFGHAFPLSYLSRLSLRPGVSLTFSARAFAGLITGAAFSPMLRHQTSSSTLLPKRGTI
jgi:hypothetical protein